MRAGDLCKSSSESRDDDDVVIVLSEDGRFSAHSCGWVGGPVVVVVELVVGGWRVQVSKWPGIPALRPAFHFHMLTFIQARSEATFGPNSPPAPSVLIPIISITKRVRVGG